MKAPGLKPLWACPRCGHRFVTKRLWHSCSHYPLAHHFANKPPGLRTLFHRYLAVIRAFGPVTVIPQKTRIVFQVRVRFAGAVVRLRGLECHLWLKRRASHPLIRRVEALLDRDFIHTFRLTDASQLDLALVALLRESYDVGCQRHLLNGELGMGSQVPAPERARPRAQRNSFKRSRRADALRDSRGAALENGRNPTKPSSKAFAARVA